MSQFKKENMLRILIKFEICGLEFGRDLFDRREHAKYILSLGFGFGLILFTIHNTRGFVYNNIQLDGVEVPCWRLFCS